MRILFAFGSATTFIVTVLVLYGIYLAVTILPPTLVRFGVAANGGRRAGPGHATPPPRTVRGTSHAPPPRPPPLQVLMLIGGGGASFLALSLLLYLS